MTFVHRLTMLAGLALALALAGCKPPGDEQAGGHEPVNTPPGQIDIPAVVRNNLGISFAKVERRDVASTIRVPGSFELQPMARHEYRMTLAGEVQFLVEQYRAVAAGEPLYRFRSPQWPELQHEIIQGEQSMATTRVAIAVAEASLAEARSNLESMRERIAQLASAEFRAADLEAQAMELEASLPRLESELRLSKTARDNAMRTWEHALHRAAAAVGMTEESLVKIHVHGDETLPAYRVVDWIVVRAVRDGIVETLGIADGAFVQPPALVLATVDPTRVRFRGLGLQSDIAKFTAGLPARIVPPQSSDYDVTDGIDATLVVGLEAQPDQRTITLIATPTEQRPWTRAGVSAFLEIIVEGGEPSLAIPNSAIVKDGLVHVFFRRDPKNPDRAVRVEAELGVDDGRWRVIKSGVRLGDEIVLAGAYELRLATAQSGAQKGGHMHADGTFHADP